ncbi:MAG: transaminase [Solirubrobacteraceae bacterium]
MTATAVDRSSLERLLQGERSRFRDTHPRSAAAYAEGGRHLFGGVPMTWMNMAAGRFPLYLQSARGARVTDVDGHDYIDFALGDTGAMAGHSPEPVVAAIRRRVDELGGLTAMMPTENAAWVGGELTRRFGPEQWSFTLTATDANRWAIRLARHVTGRPRILVFAWCYHGSVDETFALPGPGGAAVAREGNVGPPVPLDVTTRVVEYNDLDALEEALEHDDVAAVLMEPALTNIGIVLPQPGYLDGVRKLTRVHGALLINDETHTFSAGPGGATRAWDLEPDIVTIGKAIAGGIPIGAYGLTAELGARVEALDDIDLVDTGGVGGTLAGNALSIDACRAALEDVLTDNAFAGMTARAERFTAGVQRVIDDTGVPWSVIQLGCRSEYRFAQPAPVNGSASAAAGDHDLEDYLHVYMANRGVLITPFHNMALMSPATTDGDVDRHTELFAAAVGELLAAS